MGGEFFVRKVRRVSELTSAGEAFRREAPKLLKAWEGVLAAVAE